LSAVAQELLLAHERFKPLAFLAAQPNQVFLTAISFSQRLNSLDDDRDSEKRHRINDGLLVNKIMADSSNGDNTTGSSKDDNTTCSNGDSNKDDNMADSNGGSKGGGSSADNNNIPFGCRRQRRAARAKAMRA
jgi:hypothetical protein